ncbi:MAG: family 20 glycosylhydrolase [Massilibacteroides sp.]|nr:family 20 glycosylhydrolase [Massilibacteroides sp.]
MKDVIKLLCWSGLILLLTACHTKPAPNYHYSTVPLPRELYIDEGTQEITQSTLYYQSDSVQTAAKLLAQSLNRLTMKKWTVQRGTAPKGCITLQINHQLPADMYTLDTRETLRLQAGSYKSLALGIPSLLQSMEIIKRKAFFYRMLIKDRPNYAWRTVMIDVARRWIPLPILRETIELLHYYKISALHLHLSDNESFTFGTTRYPALLTYNQNGSPRYYTKAQLRELVQFAEDRGVTIIPEIDLPGHSSPLWRKMPEVFGALDAEGKPQNLYTVNMVSEKCYTALYALLDEVIAVFDTSPYFQLGG